MRKRSQLQQVVQYRPLPRLSRDIPYKITSKIMTRNKNKAGSIPLDFRHASLADKLKLFQKIYHHDYVREVFKGIQILSVVL